MQAPQRRMETAPHPRSHQMEIKVVRCKEEEEEREREVCVCVCVNRDVRATSLSLYGF